MTALESWIGRSEERRDDIRLWPAEALHAALDRPFAPPREGEALPLLWNRLYFPGNLRRADLARDGLPERGAGLTPPVKEPRRLVVGGRIASRKPLKIGRKATRIETISAIQREPEPGSQGRMQTRVTYRREYHASDGFLETEEEDVLYRGAPASQPIAPMPSPPVAAGERPLWRRAWSIDAVTLFRFAALSWDSGRTSYDVEHCLEAEGVDGLILPVPLLAILMLDLARERGPDRPVARFAWTSYLPLQHRDAFQIYGAPVTTKDGGDGADLWIAAPGDDRRVALSARLAYGLA